MKNKIIKTLALILCIPILIFTVSCSSKHPIEEFTNKMNNANNYQISITMEDVPLFGTFTITTQTDGNISYSPKSIISEEKYTETIDNIQYEYTKNSLGEWVKTKVAENTTEEDSLDITNDDSFEELFNKDNYEKDKENKNTYKQKQDVTFENFEDVKFKVEDDSCTIEMIMKLEGYNFNGKIIISKFGEISLTLPKVNE